MNKSFSANRQGKDIILPRKEFELLSLLASKPGKVFKRDEILDTVYINMALSLLKERLTEGFSCEATNIRVEPCLEIQQYFWEEEYYYLSLAGNF